MRDRPSCFEPAVLRGMLTAVLCLVWASGLYAANAGTFFGAGGLLDPAAAAKAGSTAGEKSIGGTLQVVVGQGGAAYYDQGGGWVDMEFPTANDLFAVDALSLDDLWVCGTNGVRRYDGEVWVDAEDFGQAMLAIMVRPDGVVAVGSSGRVMRNRGSGWVNLGSGTSLTLYGVWGVSADDFWICGQNGLIRRYQNDQWSSVASGTGQNLNAVWGMPGVGPFFGGANGTFLEYRDGSVQAIATGNSNALNCIHGTGVDNVWAAGANGWVWRYDGETLTTPTPGGTTAYQAIRALPSGLATIAGAGGVVQNYDGTGWSNNNIAGAGVLRGMISLPSQKNAGWWDGFARRPRGKGLMSGSGAGSAINMASGGDSFYTLGYFDHAGDLEAEGFASFDGDSWQVLPRLQPPPEGRHVAVFDGDVVAVGWDESETFGVFRWDGTDLHRLGDLSSTDVRYLGSLVIGGEEHLYVTGRVPHPSDPSAGAVLRWHPDTEEWLPVGQNLPLRYYYGMAAHSGNLYVGGITSFGPPYGGSVMRLTDGDATATWQEVFATPDYGVISLLNHQGNLYAGCGLGANVDALRRYVGPNNWQGQGAVLTTSGYIFDLASWGDRIVMVGSFPSLGTTPVNNVAYWEAGAIHALGSGIPGAQCIAVAVLDDEVYVGGFGMRRAGGRESFGIARWRDSVTGEDLEPVVTVGTPATVLPGQPATFTASVESYQTVRSVTLAYRAFDHQDFTHVAMERPPGKGNGFFQTTIAGPDIPLNGMQHFVTVQTDQAMVSVPPNAWQAAGFVGTSVTFIATQEVARRYELFGIPFAAAGTMSQIFEGHLGTYDPSRWRLERWNPATQRYLPFPQLPAAVPGRGYYIIQSNPRPMTVSGASTSTVNGASIQLEPGWNMIATPYLFNIDWSSVPRPAGVESELYGRVDDEYETQTLMQPWRGYFLYHAGVTPVTLTIPALIATTKTDAAADKAAAGKVAPAERPGCDWLVTITPSQGSRQDLIKTIGAVTLGTDGSGNLRQPPPLEHDLSVWLELEEDGRAHLLRRDLRTLDSGAVWDLVIRPAADEHGPVRLAFAGLENVPADLEVALATPQGVVDLRQTGGLWQGAAAGQTRLRLVIGDPELIEQAAGTLPQPYALLPAYPNPSNPMTTVAFTLPREGRVRVDLYDVAGRRVRTLVDEVRGPGRHAVEWDGTDDRGRGLSSGVYLMRLQAGDFSQTQKLTLVR